MTRAPFQRQDERIHPVALVTGGARRIGREIALELARQGFDIAMHFRGSREEAEDTALEIRALGRDVRLFEADLADPDAASRLVTEAVSEFGGLGVVVNNASCSKDGSAPGGNSSNWSERP